MAMVTIQEALDPCEVSSELPWEELYVFLHTVAQRLVSSLHIPAWYGQEEDIVQDIVQETVARMIERVQEAKRGERVPVRSLKSMMVVVARNYCRDLRRHDHRLVHVPSNGYFARNIAVTPDDQAIPEDIAIE